MPFFPPSPQPNNTAYVSDFYYFELEGESRFADFSCPCTVYWPWLAWGGIDDDWNAGEAMMRFQLLPDTISIPAVHDDLVGAIVSFGSEVGPQFWEVVETVEWYLDGDPSLKLVLCWARPHIVIPPAPVPITGGAGFGSAPMLSIGTLYSISVDIGSPQWFQLEDPGSGFTEQWDGTLSTGALSYAYYEGQSPPVMPDAIGSFPDFGTSFEPPQPVYLTVTSSSGTSTGLIELSKF